MAHLSRRHMLAGLFLSAAAALAVPTTRADGPADNKVDNVRPVPPYDKSVKVAADDLAKLKAGLGELKKELDSLPSALNGKKELLELIPDVEIYHKAVRYAVEYGEFFNAKEPAAATKLIAAGLQRAKELKEGKPSWTTATGYVVRGYRSKIDGSAQPYGLHVPQDYGQKSDGKYRLDFWWHGRGELLTEVNFIANQQNAGGIIPVPGQFILLPYGRYCNANKFAGEVDTFECLEHVRKHYRIDDSRLVARGFSMGGAACWQYATHFPTLWAAAAPGAGFAETREFLRDFQNETVKPEWFEKKLWRMYDATDYSLNLFNLPTVAYSGEDDSQKQAADVMAREMKKVGLELTHIIGPKTKHAYEKGAKIIVNEKIDAIVNKGKDPFPKEIKFVTYTLQYNQGGWVTLTGLKQHWEKAKVSGEIVEGVPTLKTENVTGLTVTVPDAKKVVIDGTTLEPSKTGYALVSGMWQAAKPPADLAKKPGLQGPIDDAFLNRFVMVRPTGKPLNEKVGAWAEKEMAHAVKHWRQQFRGDAIVKTDTAIADDDIKSSNLILWGDPSSNAVLAKIADKLPVKWTAAGVVVTGQTYPADVNVPVLIYPNPLNPNKYVVLNSGFTFREYDYLNNARQIPKLPDYAVIDVTTPANSRWPGKVARAGFFGEKWELLPDDGK